MYFWDANCYFGLSSRNRPGEVATAAELVQHLETAGIEKALVWHVGQYEHSPIVANTWLAQAIAPYEKLFGCYTILPDSTHEFPTGAALFDQMKQYRIRAMRAFPARHHFLLDELALKNVISEMIAHKIPLILSLAHSVTWPEVYQLLKQFPTLRCILTNYDCHGIDRYVRPLFDAFPNVMLEIATYLLDGGIEALVTHYGAERILFGSGFPDFYPRGMMLAVKHAEISESAKAAIAGGNLHRIIEEVRL